MTAPEYRQCPLTGEWVILAPERGARPQPPRARPTPQIGPCPFCPGREHDTPGEVYALRDAGTAANGPGWRLRVVPNKFPAVRPLREGEPTPPVPGWGRHELVIEGAAHRESPREFSEPELAEVFLAYRDRLATLADDPRVQAVTVFKNVGAEAGATLAHAHSQIVATPFVPAGTAREWAGAAAYHVRHGRCVLCDQLADAHRMVAETPDFVALTPPAPKAAYQVWVLPRAHAAAFPRLTAADAAQLARLVRRVVGALDRATGGAAFNWFLAPGPPRDPAGFHWRLDLWPRAARWAGFECATGCPIVAVTPEAAAAELRRACGPAAGA